MSQDVYIECGTGTGAYRAILTGKDRDTFNRVTTQPWAKNKSGEELVALILSVTGREISQVARKNKAGQLHDGAHGEPARQMFAEGGILTQTEHYKNGLLNDTDDSEPAIQKFYGKNIRLVKVERYKNGMRNDGRYGEPAIKRYNGNGKLGRIERYKNGMRNDGSRGEPAVQDFNDDGEFVLAVHYKDGKYVSETHSQDIKDRKPPPDSPPSP